MLVAEVLVLVMVVIAAIVVVGLSASAVFKMQSTDFVGTKVVAAEKRRLGLKPTDTLPRASSKIPTPANA